MWREQLIELLNNANIKVWAVGRLPDRWGGYDAHVVVRPAGRDEQQTLVCSVTVLGNDLFSGGDPDAGLEEATTAVWKVLRRNAVDVQVLGVDNYEAGGEARHPNAKGLSGTTVPVWTSQTIFATDPCRPGLT